MLQEFLEVLDVWKCIPELLRHFIFGPVGGNAHWLVVVLNQVFHNRFVGTFTKNEANGRILVRLADKVIQNGEIAVQLAEICGFKSKSTLKV